MQSKHYVLLGSGLAVAIATGVGLATMQSRSPDPIADQPPLTSPAAETPVPSAQTPLASPPKTIAVPNSNPAPVVPPPAPAPPLANPPVPAPAVISRENCVVSMAVVSDPNPPLNVRSSPSAAGSVVTQLKNGTYVTVVNQKAGWLQIKVPAEGWISQDRTEWGCNQLTARIRFPVGADATKVAARFVGTGSHRYLLNASKGQTMTLTLQEGVLPAVIGPDGKALTSAPDNTPSWTGLLPLSGEYTLLLDSNFKGYDYAFSVKVN